jgi:hypothetical protein
MKTEQQIMREFIRVRNIADKSYLRGLLFALGLRDYKTQTNEHIDAIVREFKEELQFTIKKK